MIRRAPLATRPGRTHILLLLMPVSLLLAPAIAAPLTTAPAAGCAPDGDVNQNGNVTPADARLAFQHFLGLVTLETCQQEHANVVDPQTSGSRLPMRCASSESVPGEGDVSQRRSCAPGCFSPFLHGVGETTHAHVVRGNAGD